MCASNRQLSFMDEKTSSEGLELSQGRGPDESEGSGGAAAPLLEKKHNTVDNPETGKSEQWERESVEHVLVSCRCRSRFCPDCSKSQGVALRIKAKAAMADWQAVQMWTLTIDPELFDNDPEQAFNHIRKRRAVSEWVRALNKAGFLIDNRYLCVVEWQKNGFPHWHILLHTRKIPHDIASAFWDRNRPKELPEPEQNKPGFGFVFFSATKQGKSVEHAINYVTKYVIKYPEEGFPDWVLDYYGRIDRYQTSQRFFSVTRERDCTEEDKPSETHQECTTEDDCDCPRCRGDEPRRNYRRTVRERIEACAGKCNVLLKRRRWTSEGKELKPDYSFAFSVDMDYHYAASELPHYEGGGETVLTSEDYVFFRELMQISDDSEHYTKFDPSLLWRQDGAHYNGPNYEYIIS